MKPIARFPKCTENDAAMASRPAVGAASLQRHDPLLKPMRQLSMSRRPDDASAIPDRGRAPKLGHAFLKVAVAPRPPSVIRLPQAPVRAASARILSRVTPVSIVNCYRPHTTTL